MQQDCDSNAANQWRQDSHWLRSDAAMAIITTHRTSIGGPALVDGALQTYAMVPLTGTVRAIAASGAV